MQLEQLGYGVHLINKITLAERRGNAGAGYGCCIPSACADGV